MESRIHKVRLQYMHHLTELFGAVCLFWGIIVKPIILTLKYIFFISLTQLWGLPSALLRTETCKSLGLWEYIFLNLTMQNIFYTLFLFLSLPLPPVSILTSVFWFPELWILPSGEAHRSSPAQSGQFLPSAYSPPAECEQSNKTVSQAP